jgi:hypothetical protein
MNMNKNKTVAIISISILLLIGIIASQYFHSVLNKWHENIGKSGVIQTIQIGINDNQIPKSKALDAIIEKNVEPNYKNSLVNASIYSLLNLAINIFNIICIIAIITLCILARLKKQPNEALQGIGVVPTPPHDVKG